MRYNACIKSLTLSFFAFVSLEIGMASADIYPGLSKDGASGVQLMAKKAHKERNQRREWAEEQLGIKEVPHKVYPNIERMQKFRDISKMRYRRGKDRLYVKLENLNRNVNRWYIVTIRNSKANKSLNFHLENPFANTQKFKLDPNYSDGIIIRQGDKDVRCPLWDTEATAKLTKLIAKPNLPYVAMCDFGVYVRLKVEGYRTTKEWIVEFLRDNVWGGESITNFVKESIFKDKFIVTSNSVKGLGAVDGGHDRHLSRAAIDKKFKSDEVELGELGITLKNKRLSSVKYGEWYETDAQNDVYVSIISPSVIDENILNSQLDRATKLDGVEMKAVHYLTAFDLSKFDLEYAVGTEHPRVGWSDRVRDEYKTNSKGPDGFDSVEPIVRTGLIPPYNVKHIVSTFTAGFKRSHSAFKWGPMSQLNMGSHYGFAEKEFSFQHLSRV